MTPFAQLADPGLIKSANKARLLGKGWGLAKDLITKGVWRTAGERAGTPGWLKSTSKVFWNPQTKRYTLPYWGSIGYGTAGMVSPMLGGPNLPGSELLFNATMPGLGATLAGAGAIRSGRMALPGNQDAYRQDAMEGGQGAISDFLALVNQSPGVVKHPSLYSQAYEGTGMSMDRNRFTQPYKKPGWWRTAGNFFMNPHAFIDDQVTREVRDYLNKSGSVEKQAVWPIIGAIGRGLMTGGRFLGKGIGKGVTWGLPAYGAYTGGLRCDSRTLQQTLRP